MTDSRHLRTGASARQRLAHVRPALLTLGAAIGLTLSGAALAQANSTVFGEGRVTIGAGEAAAVRSAARQEALRDAVLKGIKDATALDASAAAFAPIVNEVAKQLRDVQVREQRVEGADFVVRVEALVDRRQIKNAIRGTDLDKLNDRSFSILMLVDEFVTSTRDLNLPLRELEEYSHNAGASFRDKSLKASAASDSSKSAVAASSSSNSANASSTRVAGQSSAAMAVQGRDGYGGSGSAAAAQQTSMAGQRNTASAQSSKDNFAAAASRQSSSASVDRKDVDASSSESTVYRRLVEYQDNSKPSGNPLFLPAFSGNLRDYDLNLKDPAITRSKYFGDRTLTLAALENGAEMAKFAEFARTKANADFLMIGNSTVIGGERNSATGQISCTISAHVKMFATAGSEMISADTMGTQASGMNIEECTSRASRKVADLLAPSFANRALGYWADRAARGRQYTVELRGTRLPAAMRMAFPTAVGRTKNADVVEEKEMTDSLAKVTVTIKGKVSAMTAVYAAVSADPAFASRTLDIKMDEEVIVLCPDSCSAPPPAAAPAAPATPAAKERRK
jgi:hypothetical protein